MPPLRHKCISSVPDFRPSVNRDILACMKRQSIIRIFIGVSIALAGVLFFLFMNVYSRYSAYYLSLSTTLFVLYLFDKLFALGGSTRIPENVLHTYALLGGWIGGWVGMLFFRHKKNTNIIVLILVLATALHVAFYGLYFKHSVTLPLFGI